MSEQQTIEQQYEALGIHADTWTCVAILTKVEAKRYGFDLAASGTPIKISRDPDGKRWHIAVQGGLPKNPMAMIVNFRGEPFEPVSCTVSNEGQHPQTERAE